MKKDSIYFTIIQFHTYSQGVVWVALEYLGHEQPTDAAFALNANMIMDKFDAKLRKVKRFTVVDTRGKRRVITDKDTHRYKVATMEIPQKENSSDKVAVIRLNNNLV